MSGYLYRGGPWLAEVNAQIMEWRALGLSPQSRDRCPALTSSGAPCSRSAGHTGKHVRLRADRIRTARRAS